MSESRIVNPPQQVGLYETKRLRDTILGWLTTSARAKVPAAVLVSTPVMAIEAWIIAALFPKENDPEAIVDPAVWLANKKSCDRARPTDGPGKSCTAIETRSHRGRQPAGEGQKGVWRG
jgi:hypothetical protein